MLTLRHILKVARLFDQCGDPTPGFLVDGTANLESTGTPGRRSVLAQSLAAQELPRSEDTDAASSIAVRLEYLEDPETGDLRIVNVER